MLFNIIYHDINTKNPSTVVTKYLAI